MRAVLRIVRAVVLCLVASVVLPAQSTYGVILGTVKDASGAGVPHAKVIITNTDKNTTRERMGMAITTAKTFCPATMP